MTQLQKPDQNFLTRLKVVQQDELYLNPVLINAKLTVLKRGWKLPVKVLGKSQSQIVQKQLPTLIDRTKVYIPSDFEQVQQNHEMLEKHQHLNQRFGTYKPFTRDAKKVKKVKMTARQQDLSDDDKMDYDEMMEFGLSFNNLANDEEKKEGGLQLNLANNTDEFMGSMSGGSDEDDVDFMSVKGGVDDGFMQVADVVIQEAAEMIEIAVLATARTEVAVAATPEEGDEADDLLAQYQNKYIRDDMQRANAMNQLVIRGGGRLLFKLLESVASMEIRYVPAVNETKPLQRSMSPNEGNKISINTLKFKEIAVKKPDMIITMPDGQVIEVTEATNQRQQQLEPINYDDLPFFHAVRLRKCMEALDKQEELERIAAEEEAAKLLEAQGKKEMRKQRRENRKKQEIQDSARAALANLSLVNDTFAAE